MTRSIRPRDIASLGSNHFMDAGLIQEGELENQVSREDVLRLVIRERRKMGDRTALFHIDEFETFMNSHLKLKKIEAENAKLKNTPVEQSNLRDHAVRELTRLNAVQAKDEINDPKWSYMIDSSVLELMETLIGQHHSGGSFAVVMAMFNRLAGFETLTPITDATREWTEVGDKLWQNSRNGAAFSQDGGKTYHLVNESRKSYKLIPRWLFSATHKMSPKLAWTLQHKIHKSAPAHISRQG